MSVCEEGLAPTTFGERLLPSHPISLISSSTWLHDMTTHLFLVRPANPPPTRSPLPQGGAASAFYADWEEEEAKEHGESVLRPFMLTSFRG